jgi:hypothetical protein
VENNAQSQAHYDANMRKFSAQCKKVYSQMMRGESLTTADALRDGIGHLPRRIKDLRELGVKISDERMPDGYKKYYMTSADIAHNSETFDNGKKP